VGYVNGFGAIFILSHFHSLILTSLKPHELAHRAALLTISIALSQTSAYICKTTETGLAHRVVCLFTPQLLHR